MIRWRLDRFLMDHGVDVVRVARRSGLSTNTVYPLARGDVRRIDLATLDTLLDTLTDLTGSPVTITDLLTHESWRGTDALEALADDAARSTPTREGVRTPARSRPLASNADIGGAIVENRDARAWRRPSVDADGDSAEDGIEDLDWLARLLG